MHYPGHVRQQFAQWVEEGFPSVAVTEVDYEERLVPAATMLREMARCCDVLPRETAEAISEQLSLAPNGWRRTYGEAARRLLATELVA